MSKRLSELALFDLLVAGEKIRKVASSFSSAEELKYDFMAWDTVIREFEIIGEAMRGLIDAGFFDSEQRTVVDFRNVLIHEYFGIDAEEVWSISDRPLRELLEKTRKKIERIDPDLKKELLDELIAENAHLPFIVKVLASLDLSKN